MRSVLRSHDGHEAHAVGRVWRVGGWRLDFGDVARDLSASPERTRLTEAVAAYVRMRIPRVAATTTHYEFRRLAASLSRPAVREALDAPDAEFLIRAHADLCGVVGADQARDDTAVLRRWYILCATLCLEPFDPDAAIVMEDLRIGQRPRGVAVRRLEPGEGPLTLAEDLRLEEALTSAVDRGSLPPKIAAAALIFLELGPNPENVRRLDDVHLEPLPDAKGRRILKMPRIKKRNGSGRLAPVPRAISNRLARAIETLREAEAPSFVTSDRKGARPLFARRCGGRVRARWFYRAMLALPRRLGIKADDGLPLTLTPRRLRYTFARRHALMGVPPHVLMHLLDHTSLACILIYYDPRMLLVDELDRTIGKRLEPLADIALGRVPPPDPLALPPVTSRLGSAPFACLTCAFFQPVAASPIERLGREASDCAATLRAVAAGRLPPSPLLSDLAERAEATARGADAALKALAQPRSISSPR